MKIALISPIEETVPPKLYGGIEWIVFYLSYFLAKKNHQVHLFASKDCPILEDYQLRSIYDFSIRNKPPFNKSPQLRESVKFYSLSKTIEILLKENFDIIHNHAGWRFLIFQNLFKKKFLTTLHGSMSYDYQNFIFKKYSDSYYISISNNQRKDLPEINYIKTIYNGIDLSNFIFNEKIKDDYLIFLARFSKEKGPVEAIKTAISTNRKLKIAVKIDLHDKKYFEENKELLKNPNIDLIGEIDLKNKKFLLANAKALIAPIQWEEPFGLIFTEAMASGTPVIAFARGSVPEIIKDGETGFIVNPLDDDIRGNWIIKKTGIEGLCEAVERIYSMPKNEYLKMRYACREHVEKNFTAEKMVDEYEKVYQEILAKQK